jgi:hypothetical protein
MINCFYRKDAKGAQRAQRIIRRNIKTKLNFYLLFLLLVFTTTVNCFGQNYYYFNPWKTKSIILTEKIYIKVNTIESEEEKVFFETIVNSINNELQNQGFSCELISQNVLDSIKSQNDLILSFDLLKPAYVKLNTFDAKIPLCNRFDIEQIYPINKNLIKTVVSISVDKENEGILQFAKAFTNKLLKNTQKK